MKNLYIILLSLFPLSLIANNDNGSTGEHAVLLFNKEPHEILVDKIIVSLQKEDVALFISTCVPNQEKFDLLFKAQYQSNPEILKTLNTVGARDLIISKLKVSFQDLLEAGKKDSIKWENIKFSWTGIQSTLIESVYQIQIPFQFIYELKEYRVLIDYCTQLEKDQKIILLGEFKWEGLVKE